MPGVTPLCTSAEEQCGLERREPGLAVETGARLGLAWSVVPARGAGKSYSNWYLVPQPFCEESVILSLANSQEKNSKVAAEPACVWVSLTSPLALGAAQEHATRAIVGSRARSALFP